jgi:hypothetical protein
MIHRLEVSDMLAIQGYYDGAAFQPLEKTKVLPNQKVIITIMDEFVPKPKTSEENRLKLVEELSGSLAAYAIKDGRGIDDIMELESKAWRQAVIEKHDNA